MNDEIVDSLEQIGHQDVNSSQEIPTQEAQQEVKETPQQINFRNLKEAKEIAERERDEALKIVRQYEQKLKPDLVDEDSEITIGSDDLVEGKHLTKVDKKIKKLEEQLRNYQQKSVELSVETRLKNQFPDFDKVVSQENIQALSTAYPELANTIGASPDLYNKAVSAYTMIKKFGIYQDDIYQNERQRAQNNASKPKTVASISPQQGESPLSRANAFAEGLTDDLKKQLYKEMIDSRRNY